jgi:hypothetical protein
MTPPSRLLWGFLAATLALRLLAAFTTGFCDDEAYVVVISRVPALSYFDHPPLHQWILTAWTFVFGEGRAARLPFLGFTLVTAGALYGLTRRLFSRAAGLWAVFAFSASAYFLVYPDGYIMPDPPLLAFSALAVWGVAEILYGPGGRATGLWLGVGLALGLAGLSKYAAIFVPLGLVGYFVAERRARPWLADPRPYLGAALALACLTPALVWNAKHDWISLAFQSARAAGRFTSNMRAVREMFEEIGAQAASMTPWLLWPLLAGLAKGRRDERTRFLLWQAGPPLLLFMLMPFYGQRPISHWFNSGWLFAFPLAGMWLSERTLNFQRRFARFSALSAFVIFALYLGALWLGPFALKGARDPTRAMFDFPEAPIRAAYEQSGADFVLVESWRLGGRIGVALGPRVKICAMGDDPRGFAFACDARAFLGRNALIVRAQDKAAGVDAAAFFQAVEPLPDLAVGRRGVPEIVLKLDLGRDLLRAPPLPYGP